MINNSLNKEWKNDYYNILAIQNTSKKELEEADKLKFEHFPPVIANFYMDILSEEELTKICEGKLELKKAKLDENYNNSIIQINYKEIIKEQLNVLMQQQIEQLKQEDENFLSNEEKEVIEKADFPFIKLMTMVYVKDTSQMTKEEQDEWKNTMNNFINQQIVFGMINTYYTMKLYQDNNYVKLFKTPYNKEELWEDYANKKKGFCVVYDFKEISTKTLAQLNKLYPVLYADKKVKKEDMDVDVYNAHCASVLKVKEEVKDYDNEWMYILNHHFTEREYLMLSGLLEPIYKQTSENSTIQEILEKNYLVTRGEDLDYDYEKIIEDLKNVLESEEFTQEIKEQLQKVYNITDDQMETDFLKPEAVYLGQNFPEEEIQKYKQTVENNKIRIFKIKKTEDGRLFKALI